MHHKGRREAIESGRNSRVRGKQITGTGNSQRHIKRMPRILHKIVSTFQNGKSRMPLVEVTHLRMNMQRL